MTPELRAALYRCCRALGWITAVKAGELYELRLHRGEEQYGITYTLTWPGYREVFCYWQRISAPGKGKTAAQVVAA